MADIKVHKKDDVHVWVECETSIAFAMEEFFTFYVPGYRFMPAFKAKKWDGKIRLFSIRTREVYAGLTSYIKQFAENNKLTCEVDSNVMTKNDITPTDIVALVKTLDLHSGGDEIDCRDYQLFGIHHAITNKRTILLSPTSSGKSLIIYVIVRFLVSVLKADGRKVLVVVPNTGLVAQMASDFADYSSENGWNAAGKVHQIMAGKSKTTEAPVVVSTWQSIYRQPDSYFAQFGAIIVDECHLATAGSLKSIAEKMRHCEYRIGTTGTLEDSKTSKLVLEGLLGPVKRTITTAELMERKQVAQLKIKALALEYTDEERQAAKGAKYKDEIKYLINHKRRTRFIAKLAVSQEQNTLVLFNQIEHGKSIVEEIKKRDPERVVHFVYGAVGAEERERIRHWAETEDGIIIVASYGTFSTGTSIKNIHSIIFSSPTKSKIRTLQSIGRGLRMNKVKESVILYDIVDDLSWKKHKNYALKHFLERVEFYNREKFDVKMVKFQV